MRPPLKYETPEFETVLIVLEAAVALLGFASGTSSMWLPRDMTDDASTKHVTPAKQRWV